MDLQLNERLGRIENKLDQLKAAQKEVLTLTEACTYLGVSKSFMYNAIANVKISHSKPSRRLVYFKKADLDQFAQQNPTINPESIGFNLRKEMNKRRKRRR